MYQGKRKTKDGLFKKKMKLFYSILMGIWVGMKFYKLYDIIFESIVYII